MSCDDPPRRTGPSGAIGDRRAMIANMAPVLLPGEFSIAEVRSRKLTFNE
jgi:hypothetical protein